MSKMCNCNSVKKTVKAPQIVKIGNRSEKARPFGIAEYAANNIDVFIIDLFNKIK